MKSTVRSPWSSRRRASSMTARTSLTPIPGRTGRRSGARKLPNQEAMVVLPVPGGPGPGMRAHEPLQQGSAPARGPAPPPQPDCAVACGPPTAHANPGGNMLRLHGPAPDRWVGLAEQVLPPPSPRVAAVRAQRGRRQEDFRKLNDGSETPSPSSAEASGVHGGREIDELCGRQLSNYRPISNSRRSLTLSEP